MHIGITLHRTNQPTLLLIASLFLIACTLTPSALATPHTQQHDLLTRRVTITADPVNMRVADTLTITVHDRPIAALPAMATADPLALDWHALRTALDAALPDALTLTSGPTPLPRDPSARTFEIEPLTPGPFTIAAFELTLTVDPTKLPDFNAAAERDQDMMGMFGNALAELEQCDILAETSATTEPITLRIVSAFADGEDPTLADLRGIADPAWPFPWRATALIAGTAAVIIASALFALAAYKRRRETKILTITADTLAIRELEGVLARGDLDAARFRLLLERTSAVLRGYLEDRFRLRAPELTTAEFLREAEANALSGAALTASDRAALGEFLQRIDMVKYAGAQASRDDAERAIESVRAFITRTADPAATLITQRGRKKFERPGAAARLLRALDDAPFAPQTGGAGA